MTSLAADEGSGEICLGAGINLLTKAIDGGFELSDTVGLYLSKWEDEFTPGSLADTGNYADNAFFRLTSLPDSWTSDRRYYYPADGRKLDFYAYYPYRSLLFDNGTLLYVDICDNQSSYSDYTRSDFMTAKATGVVRSTDKVHLDFYHRLSQIVFVLQPGSGFTTDDLRVAKVRIINAHKDAIYDLSQKLDSFPVAANWMGNIIPCGSWVEKDGCLTGVKAILIPQEINTSTYIEVTVGSRRFMFKPSTPISMNPGCSREFTITVSNTGIDIETQIHPWNTCPPVAGDAEEEEPIVTMTTIENDLWFTIEKAGDIKVDWGDGHSDLNVFDHSYVDGLQEHTIKFYGADTALIVLQCNTNQLTTLVLSNNMALTNLNCERNQLKRLDLSTNLALLELNCGNNQLEKLDISKNVALTNLQCCSNRLADLNTTTNIALKKLVCCMNQLINLDVSKNVVLTHLECAANRLLSIDVSNNSALIKLYCEENKLDALDISGNTVLVTLDCFSNQLTNLVLSHNTVLKDLNCTDNLLLALDVSNNPELRSLVCYDNPMITQPDRTALIALANSLPDRVGLAQGGITIENSSAQEIIQSICDTKNWVFQK